MFRHFPIRPSEGSSIQSFSPNFEAFISPNQQQQALFLGQQQNNIPLEIIHGRQVGLAGRANPLSAMDFGATAHAAGVTAFQNEPSENEDVKMHRKEDMNGSLWKTSINSKSARTHDMELPNFLRGVAKEIVDEVCFLSRNNYIKSLTPLLSTNSEIKPLHGKRLPLPNFFNREVYYLFKFKIFNKFNGRAYHVELNKI